MTSRGIYKFKKFFNQSSTAALQLNNEKVRRNESAAYVSRME